MPKYSMLTPPREHGDGGSYVNELAKLAPFGTTWEAQAVIGNLSAGAAQDIPVCIMPTALPPAVKAGVKRAWLVFVALLSVKTTIPTDGSNYTTLQLINKGQDGTGTDVLAQLTTQTGGSSIEAFRGNLIPPTEDFAHETLPQALIKYEVSATGDWGTASPVISLKKTETGSGVAIVNGLLTLRGFWEFEV